MRLRVTISVAATILVAAGIFEAVRQARAQSTNTLPQGFVVVDANGKLLGPVIGVQYGGSGNLTTVAMPFKGEWLPVDVQRDSFLTSVSSLLFLTSDCTGQPYQYASFGPWVEATAFGAVPTLFVASGPHQAITAESYLDSSGCNKSAESWPDAVPIAPAVDLSVYTPPFSVLPK